MRESIPEDGGSIDISGGEIDVGDASTSVLAAIEGRYAPVQTTNIYSEEIELLPLQLI
jgi:hypothetical protein